MPEGHYASGRSSGEADPGDASDQCYLGEVLQYFEEGQDLFEVNYDPKAPESSDFAARAQG